jgi:hypothetical protein
MENIPPHFSSDPGSENRETNDTFSAPSFVYPPKPELENKKGNVWIRSSQVLPYISSSGIISLFLAPMDMAFDSDGIVIFHELGHFLA